MANPNVHVEFAMPDPGAAPLNLIQLFQLANILVSGSIPDEFKSYVVQHDMPGSDDHDKIWFQLDTNKRPVAIKYWWNGHWRRFYNGMIGEVRGYTGPPTNFDSNGMGEVEGDYDGWHLCNGKDGTPDFSDQFLIGAHMNNTDHNGYIDGEWVTWIGDKTGEHTGGVKDFTLTDKTTFQPSGEIGSLIVGTYQIAGAALFVGETKWGAPSVMDDAKNTTLKIMSDGNLTPEAVNIIPPFIAMAWIIFVGYQNT